MLIEVTKHIYPTLKWLKRDNLSLVLLLLVVLLISTVPFISSFSMRQVQELSITLVLSVNSVFLLTLGILLGSSSLWRDIEKRYVHSVLALPGSRDAYLVGKYIALALFLLFCSVVISALAGLVVAVSSANYPSDIPINWLNFVIAAAGDGMKSILLAAIAVLFSTVATSFYLPFFSALFIYLCGSASQQVNEYVHSPLSMPVASMVKIIAHGLYYILPNFSLFDFKVQAIYGLPVDWFQVLYAMVYFTVYISLVLGLSILIFRNRQFA